MDSSAVLVFIKQLMDEGVRPVIWKNISETEDALAGKTDLDLLIPEVDWRKARSILLLNGFVEAENYVASFPNVYHFYGEFEGDILHLNIYTRIMTGESQTKSYDLPLVNSILATQGYSYNTQIPTPDPSLSLYIFLLRHFIKISSLPSFIRYVLDKNGYDREIEVLLTRDIDLERADFCLCGIENKILFDVYNSNSHIKKLVFALGLRFKLRCFSRMTNIEALRFRYTQVIKRLLNKIILKRKKRLVHQGAIVSLTGLDGAGKSSSVEALKEWYGQHFDCLSLHLGRPKPILLTSPIRLGLKLKPLVKKRLREDKSLSTKKIGARESSVIEAIRYLSLACERQAVMKKALRLRSKGCVVILDRYPSQSLGKMDGKRIVSLGNNWLVDKFAKLEALLYESMPLADLLLLLEVPVDVAISRNQQRVKKDKETDAEIISRHQLNQGLVYKAHRTERVDMNRPIKDTMLDIKRHSWSVLN